MYLYPVYVLYSNILDYLCFNIIIYDIIKDSIIKYDIIIDNIIFYSIIKDDIIIYDITERERTMAKVSKCITIDNELFSKAIADASNISQRIEQLLQYGLLYEIQQKSEPTLNDCIEMLIRAYKNKGIEQPQVQQPEQKKEDNTSFWKRADLKKYIDEFSEYDEPFSKHIKEIDELLKLKNKYSKELEDEDEELERLSNLTRIEKQIEELVDSYRIEK